MISKQHRFAHRQMKAWNTTDAAIAKAFHITLSTKKIISARRKSLEYMQSTITKKKFIEQTAKKIIALCAGGPLLQSCGKSLETLYNTPPDKKS